MNPTAEQIEALKAYASENGRYWKAALLLDWSCDRTSGALQELRNTLGPSWLLRHGAAAVKPATLAEGIAEKRSEIAAQGLCEWPTRTPEEAAAMPACPSCGGAMELVKASEGGQVEESYFPKYPLRDAPLPRRLRAASFWACTGCEYCEEVSQRGQPAAEALAFGKAAR